MDGAVPASSVAPDVFGVDGSDAVAKWASGVGADELDYDLGHLMAYDRHPVDSDKYRRHREAHLQFRAQKNAQSLIAQLFSLPYERSEFGPLVTLPPSKFRLPRHRRIPDEKPETRWERYARLKGIQNKKRDRMVWDEEAEEWRPRHGYKRVGHDAVSTWVMEVKDGEDPTVDPFEKKALEKKDRVLKGQIAHLRNSEHAAKQRSVPAAVAAGIPSSLGLKEGRVSGVLKQVSFFIVFGGGSFYFVAESQMATTTK